MEMLPRERWPDRAWLYGDQCPLAFEALEMVQYMKGHRAEGEVPCP